MPIVQGSEPRNPQRGSSARLGWIVPLLIFGPTIYRTMRNMAAGRLTDQQLLIAGVGLVLLVALVVVVRRVNGVRNNGSSSLPTAYQPPKSVGSTPPVVRAPAPEDTPPWTPPARAGAHPLLSSDTYVPRAPQFEPIITGKVVLAGVVLAAVLSGIGLLLFQVW